MKRMISLLTLVAIATMSFAQSAAELAKQQQQLNAIHMKMLNMKPSKEAKKEAKKLKKDGWTVPAGEASIENQITKSLLYGEELMMDEEMNTTKRYYQHTAITTSGSYNAGYASARAQAMTEVASLIKTQLAGAWKNKLDNAQGSSLSAVTVDKFNQRIAGIVDQSITNAIPVVKLYRRLPNNNFEVQVRLAFDKKELNARLKRNMQKELENEGDDLNGIVNEVINNNF